MHASKLRELVGEILSSGEVDVINGIVLSLSCGVFTWEWADDVAPLALRHFELADPKASPERHLDLILAWPTFRFLRWASHDEWAGWAPAKRDTRDRFRFARRGPFDGLGGTGESERRKNPEEKSQSRWPCGRGHLFDAKVAPESAYSFAAQPQRRKSHSSERNAIARRWEESGVTLVGRESYLVKLAAS